MAAYRKISVSFWNDSFVQSLTPEGKYFYLYLMTNTRTTQCGIYEITISQMCFETGYNQETVGKLLGQFERSGKIKYSKNTNEIALKNWPKYNDSDSPKVKACVEKEVKLVKNKVLIQYLYSTDTQPQETKEETETKEEEKAEVVLWPTFDDFWEKYDKKKGKPKSQEIWKKIDQVAREKIMSHLNLYVLVEKQYRKDPERYLKNKSWEDEVILNNNGHGTTKARKETPADLAAAFAERVSQDAANRQFSNGQ